LNRRNWWVKLLRTIGIVLMGITAVFTLMGGAGTACVTLNPTGFGDKFSGIANLQWLYIIFVLGGIAIGIMGIRAVVYLIKGSKNSYRFILGTLLLGTVINLVHVFVSRALRGGSMPVDAVLYTNLFTLALFLLFGLPDIREAVVFKESAADNHANRDAAAITLGAAGLLFLTIQFLMAPTHTISSINYADVWHVSLTIIGVALIVSGILLKFNHKLHLPDTDVIFETNG